MSYIKLLILSPRNLFLRKLFINKLQRRIDIKNKNRLTNFTPTLVCSNCTGGYIYHWLGLKFKSPFINLFLWPKDFITALENWDEFLSSDLYEINSGLPYPVGKIETAGGSVFIHFMHYNSFQEAYCKWNNRKLRMDKDPNKIGFMLTNWENDISLLHRFDKLPFKNKIAFTPIEVGNISSTFRLKGLDKIKSPKQVFYTSNYNGKRFIDQFDYVNFINNLSK